MQAIHQQQTKHDYTRQMVEKKPNSFRTRRPLAGIKHIKQNNHSPRMIHRKTPTIPTQGERKELDNAETSQNQRQRQSLDPKRNYIQGLNGQKERADDSGRQTATKQFAQQDA